MRRTALFLAAGSLALEACSAAPAGKPPPAAAASAARLLSAAMSGDRVAFEAEIDRSAVREDLRRQMVEVGVQSGVQVDGGPSDFALDRMIGPDALEPVRADTHERLQAAPTPSELAGLLKALDRSKVCLTDAQDPNRCLLTFGKAKNRWRLVGMQAMTREIPLKAGG